MLIDDLLYLLTFPSIREAHAIAHTLPDGFVTPFPTEDEKDRWQELSLPQHPNHAGTIDAIRLRATKRAATPPALLRSATGRICETDDFRVDLWLSPVVMTVKEVNEF